MSTVCGPSAVGETHGGKAIHSGVHLPQCDESLQQHVVDGLGYLQECGPDCGFPYIELVPDEVVAVCFGELLECDDHMLLYGDGGFHADVLLPEGRGKPFAELEEGGLLHMEIRQPLLVVPSLQDSAVPPV